jgi:hypothetical protein
MDSSRLFSESGWYASFAKISQESVRQLWNIMQIPFQVSDSEVEHAFVSNLRHNMITASLHANPLSSSMAIQVDTHINSVLFYMYIVFILHLFYFA